MSDLVNRLNSKTIWNAPSQISPTVIIIRLHKCRILWKIHSTHWLYCNSWVMLWCSSRVSVLFEITLISTVKDLTIILLMINLTMRYWLDFKVTDWGMTVCPHQTISMIMRFGAFNQITHFLIHASCGISNSTLPWSHLHQYRTLDKGH